MIMPKETTLIRRGSISTNETNEKNKDESIRKRVSITSRWEENHFGNSLYHLQESVQSINFPHSISFEKCNGINNVVISPPFMEFKDGSEGNIMTQTITIQNFGDKAAIIRIKKPNSIALDIKPILKGYRLCPGLRLTRSVRYSYKQGCSLHSIIPIEINGTILDYHLICTRSSAHITVEPLRIDFGYVDLESVSDIKELEVLNAGSKSTRFSIDLGKSDLLIKVHPTKGILKPGDRVTVAVQIVGKYEGVYHGQFWVKSTPNICISTNVNIIKPKLIISNPSSIDNYCLLNFPVTFLGTQRYISLPLRNYSSEKTSFVILTENDGRAESIQATNEDPTFDIFKIYPQEGELQSFEEMTFTVCFCPTIKKLRSFQQKWQTKSINSICAVIKIQRIDIKEAKEYLQMESTTNVKIEEEMHEMFKNNSTKEEDTKPLSLTNTNPETLILYLCGKTESPELRFSPRTLFLGDLNINDKVQQTVNVKNPSKHLSLSFSFVPKPYIRCEPKQMYLKPNESIEVVFIIQSHFNLESPFNLEFKVYTKSTVSCQLDTSQNIFVSRSFISCTYNLLKAPAKISNARKTCRAVSFENLLPLEPDYTLTYTASEQEIRNNHREYWNHYFRFIFSRESTKEGIINNSPHKLGVESLSCYSLEDSKIRSSSTPKKILQKCLKPRPYQNKKDCFVKPLTPLEIYKISISPINIDFRKVALNTTSTTSLSFDNRNNFPIRLSLSNSNSKNIGFPDGHKTVISPNTKRVLSITFQSRQYGEFNSYLYYIINDRHKYRLPIFAWVVAKSLELKTKEVTFEKDAIAQEAYRIPFKAIELENTLNADIKFRWAVPENVNFIIESKSGIVPGNRSLYLYVSQTFDPAKLNAGEAILQTEDGGRTTLKLKTLLHSPNVTLLEENLNIGKVSLNFERKVQAWMYNFESFDVFFEIDDRTIFKGIKIEPTCGSISPRSIAKLNVTLKFGVCIESSMSVDIIIQKCLTLQLKLNFVVVFPKLRIEPRELRLRRISLNSCCTKEIIATNLTETDTTLRFLLREYPEFHISYSASQNDNYIENSIIEIAPRSAVQLFLHFLPFDVASYAFNLPIVVNELLGPVDCHFLSIEHLTVKGGPFADIPGVRLLALPATLPVVHVESSVVHPIVQINKLKFHLTSAISKDELRIRGNHEIGAIEVILCTSVINSKENPFLINWKSGAKAKYTEDSIRFSLLPNEQACFEISFKGREAELCAIEIPICLEEDGDRKFYNLLVINGSRKFPYIRSEALEVYFAPMPLKTESRVRFSVRVDNYAEPTYIRAEVFSSNGILENETFKVIFPEKNVINPCCLQEIPIEICFKSLSPVSVSRQVILSDVENLASVEISVYASADNSLLTTHFYEKKLVSNFILPKQSGEILQKHSRRTNSAENLKLESSSTSLDSSASKAGKREARETRLPSEDSHKSLPLRRRESSFVSDVALNNSFGSLETSQPSHFKHTQDFQLKEPEIYIDRSIEAVENWLYSSVLHYQFNPKLGDGMTFIPLPCAPSGSNSKNKKKAYPKPISLLDILKHFMDVDAKCSSPIKQNEDKMCREKCACKILNTYSNIFECLHLKGACVAHICPRFLLPYDEYEKIENVDYTLMEDDFKIRSRYTWLDLFLQIYKCCVVTQVNEELLKKHFSFLENAKKIDSFIYNDCKLEVSGVVQIAKRHCEKSKPERILLAWLEYNYRVNFGSKHVNDFADCLSDGLAFIAVMINYCPFLKDEFFRNIYLNPDLTEKKMHNAICLVSAWKKIRLGFIIRPLDIVNAHPIKMLMHAVYLFLNLPTYFIKDKITFECPLTLSISKSIKLAKANNQMNYIVQFFENNLNLFTSKATLSVHPRKNQRIKVHFRARKIEKTRVFLLLCGSAIGSDKRENQLFLLEGFPNKLHISNKYIIKGKLYQTIRKNLTINAPYDHETEYKIWFSEEYPNNFEGLQLMRWSDLQLKQLARNLIVQQTSVKVLKDSQDFNLTITISCLTPETQSYWIFFRSKMSDFVVQVKVKCQLSVTDRVSVKINNQSCTFPNKLKQSSGEYPTNQIISIPSVNIQLQNCLIQLFAITLNPYEELFWSTYLDKAMAFQFIQLFVKTACTSTHKELKYLFNSSITFELHASQSQVTALPRSVIVNDKYNPDSKIEILLRITSYDPKVTNASIILTSVDRKEIRICNVDIEYERPHKVSSLNTVSEKCLTNSEKCQ